jgi:hypothetical protein
MNQTMLLPPFSKWVECVAGTWMNCNLYDVHGLESMDHKYHVNAYKPGSWILHAAGIEHGLRMRLLKQYAEALHEQK